MNTRRIIKVTSLVAFAGVLLAAFVAVGSPAQAQEDRYETCALYNRIVSSGGQQAADSAAALQALGVPNPPGLENVLEVIINAEADVPPIGSRPTNDAREIAYDELANYFGDICAGIDLCPLINQAVATNDASSAEAARLARGITFPSPPGIDAALALIGGEIAESPFHNTIAEAQAQVGEYFMCQAPSTSVPGSGGAGDVAETCGDLAVLSIPEGPFAIEAAERLRARGAPNPAGIEAALDIIVAAADFANEPPPLVEIDAAVATLNDYFGGACASIDRCAFVTQIAGSDAAAAADAARLLRRIETPSPPGIDAALALIAGQIDESPFHDSVAQARDQIIGYYPCGEPGADGSGGQIAFTGATSGPLAAVGFALVATGAGVLQIRRRLLASQL